MPSRGLLRIPPEQEGQLILRGGRSTTTNHDDEDEPLWIGDVVLWMIPHVCFTCVETFTKTGQADFSAFSNSSSMNLRESDDGSSIVVTTDSHFPSVFPALPLLHALVEAGSRFLVMVEALWPDEAANALSELRLQEARTRSCLLSESERKVQAVHE